MSVRIQTIPCAHGYKSVWITWEDTQLDETHLADQCRVATCRPCNPNIGPIWQVESTLPLTLSPSIQVGGQYSHHGYVREGKWVDA